jgi:hypothetical protein
MELTQTQIEAINKECPYGQGIFREPFGIPNNIKELVVYAKWTSGGRGGSCWDDENTVNEHYDCYRPSDAFKVLDITLKVLRPDITLLEYREIEALKQSNTETDYGYYGDYTEDTIEWIKLSDLYEAVDKIKREEI